MAISSTTRVAGPFIGSGSTATFPFSFKVFEATDLYVVELNTTTGVSTVLALTTDYSATLNADQDTSPGGSITLTAGNLAAGYTLTITTALAALQNVDLTNGGAFYPDVINGALDYLTILIQQMADQLGLMLQFPITDSGGNFTLPSAPLRETKILGFDASGALKLYTMFAGSLTGTIDGVNKTFTLTNGGVALTAAPAQATVWLNFPQIPGVGYTLGPNPGQVTFTTAPHPGGVGIPADYLYAQGLV